MRPRTTLVMASALSLLLGACGSTVRPAQGTDGPAATMADADSQLVASGAGPASAGSTATTTDGTGAATTGQSPTAAVPTTARPGGRPPTPAGTGPVGGPPSAGAVTGGSGAVPAGDAQDPAATAPGSAADGDPAADAAPAPAGPQGAGTAEPLDIGIVLTRTSNADDFGVTFDTVGEDAIYTALIDAINDEGGLAGRPINPIYAETDTGSTNWDTDMAEACATFTQDHQVDVVLGYVFGHFDALEGCLTGQGIPHLSTTFAAPDAIAYGEHPLLLTLSTPAYERRSLAKVEAGLATGRLGPDNRVGVVFEDCPIERRGYDSTVKPGMEALGVTIAAEFSLSCSNGAGEAASSAAEAGSLVLQFRAADVDTILIQSRSEGPAVLVIGLQAESQGWRPTYLVSSLANAAVLAGQLPEGQLDNVRGYGWLPTQDVFPADAPPLSPAAERCVALAASQDVHLTTSVDFSFAFNLCEGLFLYEQALLTSGGQTDGQAVVGAIESLGGGYVSSLNIGGASQFGPGRHDGPSTYREFNYDRDCGCFRYGAHQGTFQQ